LFWLLPVLVALCFLPRRLLRQGRLSFVVRLLAVALIVVTLAGPERHQSEFRARTTALIDQSASIPSAGQELFVNALADLARAAPERSIEVVPFARQAASNEFEVNSLTTTAEIRSQLANFSRQLDLGATDLTQAINSTLARIDSSSLILLSDGQETSGNIRQAIAEIATKGVAIYPLMPDESPFLEAGLSISSLHAPLLVNSGDLAEVRIATRNTLAVSADATLEVWLDNQKLYANKISVPAFSEKLITVKTPALEGGLKRLRATINGLDSYRWLSVKSRSRVLLLNGAKEDERLLRQLLTAKGYAIESIVADGSSTISTNFENTSLVVLNNIARKQLPSQFLPKLKDEVARGMGLVTIGGERSYGLGDYLNTPLEEISPLKFTPPKTTKKRLTSAVIILIDKSKSMREDDKIEAARRAAVVAIDGLKDDDLVGVIGFDDAPFELIPLRPVAENRQVASSRLRHLYADGRTKLRSSLQLVLRKMQGVEASRKHVILLSDGEAADALEGYDAELAAFRQNGVTLTAIALGVDADATTMKVLAQQGRGAFYHTFDPSQLPEIFLQDIKVSTGEKTLKERDQYLVKQGQAGVLSQLR